MFIAYACRPIHRSFTFHLLCPYSVSTMQIELGEHLLKAHPDQTSLCCQRSVVTVSG